MILLTFFPFLQSRASWKSRYVLNLSPPPPNFFSLTLSSMRSSILSLCCLNREGFSRSSYSISLCLMTVLTHPLIPLTSWCHSLLNWHSLSDKFFSTAFMSYSVSSPLKCCCSQISAFQPFLYHISYIDNKTIPISYWDKLDTVEKCLNGIGKKKKKWLPSLYVV